MESILSQGREYKGAQYIVGKDFSHWVRTVHRRLISLAKAKSVPFSRMYKTPFIDSKGYTYDEQSQSVKE